MEMICTKCCEQVRPGAKFCGHCGWEVRHAIEPVHAQQAYDIVPPAVVHPPVVHRHADELAARVQLEAMTRLNPLMNHERMKAMVMAIAAHGGTGTVGFWSDD